MYQACPEVAGLSQLNEAVGNKAKKSALDIRETGIRSAQTEQCIASEKDTEKKAQG